MYDYVTHQCLLLTKWSTPLIHTTARSISLLTSDMPKTRKKRKTRATDLALQLSSPKRDLFSQLPLEMLAEILRFTSTKDILAVARTSSHFCNTLVSTQSNRIWSLARARFNPPLPDPTPNFTEASFAAYIFDGGPCEVRIVLS